MHDKFWVSESYIYENTKTGNGDWGVIQSGQRMIDIVTQHEFINAQAVLGNKNDQDDIEHESYQPYDTAEQFIAGLSNAYLNKSQESVAIVYYLNRATLNLTKVLVAGGGLGSGVVSQFECEIGNFDDMISKNDEIMNELQKIADEHNADILRAVPEESKGLENKL